MRRARLRPEYAWPYPRLRPEQWYAIREAVQTADDPDWLWIVGDVHPEFVYAPHFEIDGSASSADAAAREARLRSEHASRYPAVMAGIWVRARNLLRDLRASDEPPIADRRAQRLPDEHFEFRDAPAEPDDH